MQTVTQNLQEISDRGNPSIPFYVYYHDAINYNLYVHWHDEYEIIYVEKGCVEFLVNTQPIRIEAGQCLFINSGQLHSARPATSEPTLHHALLFDIHLLSSPTSDYCQSHYISPLTNGQLGFTQLITPQQPGGTEIIQSVQALLKCYYHKTPGYELSIKGTLLTLIGHFSGNHLLYSTESVTPSLPDHKVQHIKKVLNYIHLHYKEKIYIEELAQCIDMNPHYFCRFFKSHIGKTPIEYVNAYRIKQATYLLARPELRISDICYEVGFDNFSYFIKKFKTYTGKTPSRYR